MSNDDEKPMKFEVAPHERLRFVSRIESIFIDKVFDIEWAFLSDESYIHDFSPSNDFDKKKEALDSGKCIFEITRISGKKREIREKIRFESYPVYFKIDTLRKTKDTFDVDIAEVFDKPLVEIFLFILSRMTEEKKKELGLS